MVRRAAFCAFVSILAASAASAADEKPPSTLSVSGQGTVMAAPDEANFPSGVVSQAPTASAALAANSRAMNAVFATLKRLGIPDKDIQTSDFSVSPQYQQCKPNVACPQRIVGYQVSNNVDVTVEDMSKTGPVLDALVSSGSNQIGGIGFSIHDPKPLLAKARQAAVADAIERAQTIAKAAGVTLGPILSISESGYEAPRPVYAMRAMAMPAPPPPVAGGQESLSATVSITWALK